MFPSVFLQIASPTKRRTGNTILANIPNFRLSPAKSDTNPTKVGPAEHQKSPPMPARQIRLFLLLAKLPQPC